MCTSKYILSFAVLLFVGKLYPQSGATGNSGGAMGALGYINFTASVGGDQQLTGNTTVTIGPSGNLDIYGALQVDNGSTLELLSGAVVNLYGDITVNGVLAIASGATLNYYGKNWVNGNLAQVTNNGTPSATPGNPVNFITPQPAVPADWLTVTPALSAYGGATQSQNISGNNIGMNIVMHVQNSSNISLVSTNTSISGQLSFDVANGYVITNSNEFVFTTTGSYLGASTDRYIQTNSNSGRVSKMGLINGSSFLFPVGFSIPNSYTPANIQVTAGSTDNYHVNVNDFATSPANEAIVNPNVNRTWQVYSELNTGNTSTSLSFVHYAALESAGYTRNNSSVFFMTDVGNWRPKSCSAETSGPFGLPANYYSQTIASVELPACPGCGTQANGIYYTASNCSVDILPVVLGSFSASLKNCSVQLKWNTHSEVNTRTFIIERSDISGVWKTVTAMVATGNSVIGGRYSYIDNEAGSGKILYRLKILGVDGSYIYGPVAQVQKLCEKITVYPNPAQNSVYINLPPRHERATVMLYDLHGRRIKTGTEKSPGVWKINLSSLAAGVYIIQVMRGNTIVKTERIIKY